MVIEHCKTKILNPSKENKISASEAIVYSDFPANGIQVNIDAEKK